jgi:hypothetical protein
MVMEDGTNLGKGNGSEWAVMPFLGDGIPMSETIAQWEMPTPLDRVSDGRLEGQDEFSCEFCSDKKAGYFRSLEKIIACGAGNKKLIWMSDWQKKREKTGKKEVKSESSANHSG